MPSDLMAALEDADIELHAQNVSFEKIIAKHVMTRQAYWPPIAENRWHCTAAQGAALSLPRSLDDAGAALDLATRKDKEGHRVMLKLSKPRKPTKNNAEKWHSKPVDFAKLHRYCINDVDTEIAIDDATIPLSRVERAVWLLDQKINERGIPIDLETVNSILAIDHGVKSTLNARLQEITGGQLRSAGQNQAFIHWLAENGVNVDNMQKETVACELQKPHSEIVLEALRIRQRLGKSSVRKHEGYARRTCSDGRLRGDMLYHAASTGRWGGSGVNLMNCPRGKLKKDELKTAILVVRQESPDLLEFLYDDISMVLSSLVRSMVKASPGKRLIVSDFASIEARVLPWVANETKLLNQFRNGEDVYVDMADKLNGTRQLGKVAILGLGYQMGASRFVESAADFGIDLSEEDAQVAVDTYRETYQNIKRFWWKCNEAAIDAVEMNEPKSVNRITFHTEGKFLFCTLPSGRRIAYYEPRVKDEMMPWGKIKPQLSYMGRNSQTRKWERQRTYGGKLTENIVQAIARDLLVVAMLKLDRMGYPIILHVYDEVVIEADKGFGSLAEVNHVMSTPPKWAATCPVAAEGFEAERYRK